MTIAEREFKEYKKRAVKAAKELSYDDSVISDIKSCKTSVEISNVMKAARLNGSYRHGGYECC